MAFLSCKESSSSRQQIGGKSRYEKSNIAALGFSSLFNILRDFSLFPKWMYTGKSRSQEQYREKYTREKADTTSDDNHAIEKGTTVFQDSKPKSYKCAMRHAAPLQVRRTQINPRFVSYCFSQTRFL